MSLSVRGSGFVSSSAVFFGGAAKAATFVSSGELTIQVSANEVASAQTILVRVENPSPGGGSSNIMGLTVLPPPPDPYDPYDPYDDY
jgi:hypothetical protein